MFSVFDKTYDNGLYGLLTSTNVLSNAAFSNSRCRFSFITRKTKIDNIITHAPIITNFAIVSFSTGSFKSGGCKPTISCHSLTCFYINFSLTNPKGAFFYLRFLNFYTLTQPINLLFSFSRHLLYPYLVFSQMARILAF